MDAIELLKLGILPAKSAQESLGLTQAEIAQMWIEGMTYHHARLAKLARQQFMETGEAAKWFCNWKPETESEKRLAEEVESAIDVVERMYSNLLAATSNGIISDSDMILQIDATSKAEGIRAKKGSYDRSHKLVIVGLVGDHNFDPVDGSVEFEEGCRSFKLRLAYQNGLPSLASLIEDVCAYPLILKSRAKVTGKGFMDEGEINEKYRLIPFHDKHEEMTRYYTSH